VSKPYGRVFLASLPPMTHTRTLADIQRFFAEEPAAQDLSGGFDRAPEVFAP